MERNERIQNRMIILLILVLIYVSSIDIETRIIPDGITLIGILVALNYQLYCGNIEVSIMGMTAGVLIIWVLNILKVNNLGGGDAKLMSLIGACTSWQIVLGTALIANLVSMPHRDKELMLQKPYAYAPFITIGFVISWTVKYFLKI